MHTLVNRVVRSVVLCAVVAATLVLGTAPVEGSTSPGFASRSELGGEQALRALGDRLPAAAALNGMTSKRLTEILLSDDTASVVGDGYLMYTDPGWEGSRELDTRAAPFPLEDTFLLHSRPSATRTIYLDFDGRNVSNTIWNAFWEHGLPNGFRQGYSLDDDPAFSDVELEQIQNVWKRVSEDFAPFDINVTTQNPGSDGIDRSSSSDDTFGSIVLVSNDWDAAEVLCNNQCGGKANVGAFDAYPLHMYRQPAWVFVHNLGYDTKNIAEAASHEAGHNLGLRHDGRVSPQEEYYAGHDVWAPIMGVGYDRPVAQWSAGEYEGASNSEDDFAVMASHEALLVADEAPAGIEGAPQATSVSGIITSSEDVDTYSLGVCVGPVVVTTKGASPSPNLNIRLSLLNAQGSVQHVSDPPVEFLSWDVASGLDGHLAVNGSGTTTYVQVEGAGHNGPDGGFSKYGSVGAYTITSTGCGRPTAPASLTVDPAINGRSATLKWDAPENHGDSPTNRYILTRTDPGNPPQPVDWVGGEYTWTGLTPGVTYTFTVRAANASGPGTPISKTVLTPPPPGPPSALTVTPATDGRSANLAWVAPQNQGGSPVESYLLTRTDPGAAPQPVEIKGGAHTWAGLTPGVKYTFSVRGVNQSGPGMPLSKDATMPLPPVPPGAPATLSVAPAPDGRSADLVWTMPTDNGGAAVERYLVDRTDPVAAPPPVESANSTHEWLGLLPGASYTFTVRAVNSAGPGPAATATATMSAPPSAPGVLTVATAPDGRSATLRWGVAHSDGSSQVRYRLTRSDSRGTPDPVMVEGGPYTWDRLEPGTAYTFTVQAINDAGPGAQISQTATMSAPPSAPGVLTVATAPDGRSATLRWGVAHSDGSSQVRYRLTRSDSRGTPDPVMVEGGPYTWDRLEPGTAYTFTVQAINDAGPGAQISQTATMAATPSAPGALTLASALDGRSVTLTWAAATSDGSSQVRYRLTRTDPHGAPEPVTVEAGPYIWKRLEPGTAYAFTVQAINDAGPGGAVSKTATTSDPSNPSNPTDPTGPVVGSVTTSTGVSGSSVKARRVTLSAQVSAPSVPTSGSVAFVDSKTGAMFGVAPVLNGTATLSLRKLSPGPLGVTATYTPVPGAQWSPQLALRM